MSSEYDPITVISLVASVIKAFTSGYDLYRTWREKKKASNRALDSSLSSSGGLIRQQYDQGFSILGKEFAKGDGEGHPEFETSVKMSFAHKVSKGICREQLMAQVIFLQTKLLAVFESAFQNGAQAQITLNLADLLSTSEAGRIASIDALSGLYQRMSVSRQIPRDLGRPTPSRRFLFFRRSAANTPPNPLERAPTRGPPPNKGTICAWSVRLQLDDNEPIPPQQKCPCGYSWRGWRPYVELGEATAGPRFIAKSHCIGNNGWYCILCPKEPDGKVIKFPTIEGLKLHITVVHSKEEILQERDIFENLFFLPA